MEGTVNYLDVLARRCQAAADLYDDAWYCFLVRDGAEHREAMNLAADVFKAERHMYITARHALDPTDTQRWEDRVVSSGNKEGGDDRI